MKRLTIISLLISCIAISAVAGTYKSLNGKFKIEYPEGWIQIDYNTVDLFLGRSGANRQMFDYEAVFAPQESVPFFEKEYLLLKLDRRDNFGQKQIDSSLARLSALYESQMINKPVGDFVAAARAGSPTYDRRHHIATVLNEVVQADGSVVSNLLMMKYYDGGVASFYFYAPEDMLQENLSVFLTIVKSFDTSMLDTDSTGQEVKVADLENIETVTPDMDEVESNYSPLYIFGPLGFMVIVIVLVLARKKKKSV